MFAVVLYIFTAILVTLPTLGYLYKKWVWSYWKRRGLETYEPKFLDIGLQYSKSYRYFKKKGLKHGGTYMLFHPHYVPVDLDIIKKILVSDFDHFVNRGIFDCKNEESINAHLFNLEDQHWKDLRQKLTPIFTSGKLKMMFQTIAETTWDLKNVFQKHADSKIPLDIKDATSRLTTDIIGSVAFGIQCKSFQNPSSDFIKFGKMVLHNMDRKLTILYLSNSLPKVLIKTCHMILRRFMKSQSLQFDHHKFIETIVKETVAYREENNIHRNDFLHLLLLLKNTSSLEEGKNVSIKPKKGTVVNLTMSELTAQCFLFFAAGYDTTSTTMTFALYELARNPEIQEKLRQEIYEALAENNGEMSYDVIMKMTYLDRVVSETLRMHPAAKCIVRKCKENYRVPDTDFIIRKNETIMIPVEALHNDPDLYPEPGKFDPDRFSPDRKASMNPIQFLPFGEGPRMCIGARFGQVQVKVCLTCILNKFRLSLNDKTKLPLNLREAFLASGLKDSLWFNIEEI